MKKGFFVLICSISIAGCATIPRQAPDATAAMQREFYPDAYTYKVGDLVLSLPVGYYEFVYTRLRFAEYLLREGRPKPGVEQERYLMLPPDALAPRREFFLLDQHHLLIFSHEFQLMEGFPPSLEVLRRDGASWSDVSASVLPKWTRTPAAVAFEPGSEVIRVKAGKREEKFRWDGSKLAPVKYQ